MYGSLMCLIDNTGALRYRGISSIRLWIQKPNIFEGSVQCWLWDLFTNKTIQNYTSMKGIPKGNSWSFKIVAV